MMNEVMMGRAKKLVDDGDVEYLHTNGNTHHFVGKGHKQNDGVAYDITCEIAINNEIRWACDCDYNEWHDDCKHTIACGMIVKNKELRVEYKIIESNDDDGRDDRHLQADEVVGKVVYKMESDDD